MAERERSERKNVQTKLTEETKKPPTEREPQSGSESADAPIDISALVTKKDPEAKAAPGPGKPIEPKVEVPEGPAVRFDGLLKLMENFAENKLVNGDSEVFVNGQKLRSVSMLGADGGFSLNLVSK